MAKKLIYDVFGCDWYNEPLNIYFTQFINQKIAEGWEPLGAPIRHPDSNKQYWWQAMTMRVSNYD